MPVETYLIKVAENATALQVQGILKVVLGTGGRIEMIAGRTVIANIDSSYAGLVRQTPGVALAGGIDFRGRKIPKIIKTASDEKPAGS